MGVQPVDAYMPPDDAFVAPVRHLGFVIETTVPMQGIFTVVTTCSPS